MVSKVLDGEGVRALETDQQRILDSVADGICGCDANGNATFCNAALLAILNQQIEEVLGNSIHDLLHSSCPAGRRHSAEECGLWQAVRNHQTAHLTREVLCRKGGSYLSVEFLVRPLPQLCGATSCVVTVRDVTEVQRAEEILRENEEKFRKILASSPDIAWTSDQDGRMIYISPRAEEVLGYTSQEMYAGTKHLWMSLIHAEDFGRVNRAYLALFERQIPFDEEFRVRRKDGTWIWVHDRAVGTHRDKDRLYAHGFLSDVTQRKQAEAALRSQTAFLEAQTNSTIDGMLVVDRFGKRLLANERLVQLFQIPPAILANDDDDTMLNHVAGLMKDPQLFRVKVKYLYHHPSVTSRDEIELTNGMCLDRYSAPVVDKNGIYYGRIWSFRDITERKQHEDALRQLSLAVEQSPVSVVITDPQGNITYVNRKFTECTGYTAKEVLGSNPRVLNAGQCTPEIYRNLWTTITHGREWHGEFCNRKKNGDIYWESASITPITNTKGAITHFLAVKEDITERRSLEAQLRHAQKLEGIGQLAAGIAHEINTPTQFVSDNLTFLRESWKSAYSLLEEYRATVRALPEPPAGILQTLEKAELDCDLDFIRDEVPRAIEQSLDGASRVANIVRAMKEFSHPDAPEKTATDLNKAIESTITVARSEWKYVSEIVTEFDPTLPRIVCYPGDINQVVLNLIVNAADAIKEKSKEGEKGTITVGTRMRDGWVEISVGDTGCGIAENIRTRVFDPFFTTKEVGKGTGQGLALAYTVVVKKHGGQIRFETEAGRGTTFFIALPIHLREPEKEQ